MVRACSARRDVGRSRRRFGELRGKDFLQDDAGEPDGGEEAAGRPAPTTPALPRRRGRPRKADLMALPNAQILRIRREDGPDEITLHLSGSLVLAHLLTLRDEAFTALGARPKRLVIDLRSVATTEIAAISTLVTIARVAGMVRVPFNIIPSRGLRPMLEETGLTRLLPPLDPATGLESNGGRDGGASADDDGRAADGTEDGDPDADEKISGAD
jgi:ABC-type transporter Mla MlaB component